VKNRTFLLVVIVLLVAVFTWSVSTVVGAAIAGGKDEFQQWRAQNARTYYLIWGAEMVALCVPLLWVASSRLRAQEAAHEKQALETRGLGKLAGEALRGSERATATLIELLDDPELAVRCQSARALVMVDKPESNKELFRKVPYWHGDQKMAMIDILRRMKDLRARKLLKVLAEDRSQFVAARARSALATTSGHSTDMTQILAQRKREAVAAEGRAAAKKKMSRGAAARTATPEPEPAPSAAAAAPPASPAATKPPLGTPADEAAEAGATGTTEPSSP
jgi:hypothetical protein